MNECTQSQTTLPGSGEVADSDTMVTTGLLLAPSQQLIGLGEPVCRTEQTSHRTNTGQETSFQKFLENHEKKLE